MQIINRNHWDHLSNPQSSFLVGWLLYTYQGRMVAGEWGTWKATSPPNLRSRRVSKFTSPGRKEHLAGAGPFHHLLLLLSGAPAISQGVPAQPQESSLGSFVRSKKIEISVFPLNLLSPTKSPGMGPEEHSNKLAHLEYVSPTDGRVVRFSPMI